ncbi:MAG: hypothetical protein K2M16_02250, partial [Muribaculaceae bacterium]|nr:hypothetical protein [Muribaculaceae bacterium]
PRPPPSPPPLYSAAASDVYNNAEGDVLVKCLLNEQEVRLPANPVSGPYYRWSDLRDYYLEKANRY